MLWTFAAFNSFVNWPHLFASFALWKTFDWPLSYHCITLYVWATYSLCESHHLECTDLQTSHITQALFRPNIGVSFHESSTSYPKLISDSNSPSSLDHTYTRIIDKSFLRPHLLNTSRERNIITPNSPIEILHIAFLRLSDVDPWPRHRSSTPHSPLLRYSGPMHHSTTRSTTLIW